jgi:predicted alpha/beta-fold hydrolase
MSKLLVKEYPGLKTPFWKKNPHIQTLAAVFLKPRAATEIPISNLVPLSDGDRLAIHDDVPDSWSRGDRIAILLHGLGGSHQSNYVARISSRLRERGIRTVRIDMRGFGDSKLISTGHLYAGCSHDLEDVIEFVHQRQPLSPISLIGFSLGGNIILKTLTDWSDQPHANVDSAIAVSPPIDLTYCSANLRSHGNRFYEYYFARQLKKQLIYRRRHVLNLIDNGLNPLPDRLVHFDDQFTAPVNGYSGAREYYRKCSTFDRLKRIHVPVVVVAAEDDPVVPFEMFDAGLFSSQIEFVSTRRGGHLGFLGNRRSDPDHYWLDWRICRWICNLDSNSKS